MTTIFVTFTQEGTHKWPNAPERRAYLRYPHRHLFHVRVETGVGHDDREIEFHDLLEISKAYFNRALVAIPESRSCEQMARLVATLLASQYKRVFTVTVSEDGECGATVSEEPAGAGAGEAF